VTGDVARYRGWLRFLAGRWRILVAVGLLTTLLVTIGPGVLIETLGGASGPRLAAVAALLWVWLIVGALNVWLLLRSLTAISFRRFLREYLVAWAASLLIPGQLGDATQVLLLRRQGISIATSGAAYLLDKLVSVSWMALVASAALAVLLPEHRWIAWSSAAAVVAGVACSGRIARGLAGSPMGGRLSALGGSAGLMDELRTLARHRRLLLANSALTVGKWLVMAWIYRMTFASLGVELEWSRAATIPVLASLVAYLPVSIGGAGTMEWTAVALFGRLGIGATTVTAAYLLIRGVLLGSAAMLAAASGLERGRLRAGEGPA